MRLRLFPVLIATALIALTVRVGDLWTGLGTIARAQTAAQGESATGSRQNAASEDPTPPEVEGARIMNLPSDPFSMSDEEIDLLQSLAERRKQLDLRAHQLEQRETLLMAVERRIDEKVEALKALQSSIQEENESQYKSLVKIYENMKPKDAARIFENLDMAILLPVSERMKERKLAAILAKMDTKKARVLTTELAQRRNTQDGQQAMGSDQLPGGQAPVQ
jgi:flagellar motility protein MotE (MotC chaperone)